MINFIYKIISFFAICIFFLCFSEKVSAQLPGWGSMGSGTNGVVNSIIEFNKELIVAGSFTSPARNIAKYNGTSWSSLGTGTNDTIYGLKIYGNKLIVVGAFDSAGGVSCNNIAQWDGTTWSALGLGTNGTIYSVDSAGTYLRIGGSFTTAGGVNCSHIARWQGTNWSAMGTGVNDNVYVLKQFGNGLIIGGAFTMAGSVTAKRIVRFDLTSGAYTALGSGIDSNNVYAMTIFDSSLYVGGSFATIGGITVNHLAIWNGTNWNSAGGGLNGTVKSLAPYNVISILAGGSFTNAGGVSASNIAFCYGSTYGALGGGLSGGTPVVNAILNWRLVIIAGGSFTSPPSNIARYGALPVAPELILPVDGANGISVTPTFTWAQFAAMYSFKIQIARDANFTNMTLSDSNIYVPQYSVSPSTPLLNLTVYFWRVNASNGFGNGPYSIIRFFSTGFIGVINNQEIPLVFSLYQNFPNPFNPTTKIRFDLPAIGKSAPLKFYIYDVNGKNISEVLNTDYSPGKWEINFNADNMASGIYFYKIEAGPYVQTNKMILLK